MFASSPRVACRPRRCGGRRSLGAPATAAASAPQPAPASSPAPFSASGGGFQSEPGAYSASFERRDPQPGAAAGTATAAAAPLAPGEVPAVQLLSEARARPRRTAHEVAALPLGRADLPPPPPHPAPAARRPPPYPPPQAGADYAPLRDLLAAGQWEKADDETRLKLTQLAGEDAEEREWVYFTARRRRRAHGRARGGCG